MEYDKKKRGNVMFCRNCGAKLPEGAKFCGSCGTKLTSAEDNLTVNKASKAKTSGKRKGIGKVIAIVLVVALVVAAVAMVLPVLGGKTVYLQTEIVSNYPTYKNVIRYDYNDEGKIVSYEYSYKNTEAEGVTDGYSWEYEYEDGRIVAAEYSADNGDNIRLEYEYDRKGNLEAVESDYFECEVECDQEGRIVEIEQEGDIFSQRMSYSYYSNGILKEMEFSNNYMEEIYAYNEDGRVLERTLIYSGEKYSFDEYEYDKNGNQLSRTIILYSGGKKNIITEQTFTYDKKGNLIGYTLDKEDTEGKMAMECEVVREDDTDVFIITDLSGDAKVIKSMVNDLEEDDVYMEREYDKHGNLIRVENFATGAEDEYEYMAFKAPRGYEKADIQDPEYFYRVTW